MYELMNSKYFMKTIKKVVPKILHNDIFLKFFPWLERKNFPFYLTLSTK